MALDPGQQGQDMEQAPGLPPGPQLQSGVHPNGLLGGRAWQWNGALCTHQEDPEHPHGLPSNRAQDCTLGKGPHLPLGTAGLLRALGQEWGVNWGYALGAESRCQPRASR